VFDKMYYEENNIIPKKEYNNIINTLHKEKKFRPARISVVRKIFFNREINYLSDAVSVNHGNSDSYYDDRLADGSVDSREEVQERRPYLQELSEAVREAV
jgi:hypothetical protein